MIEVEPVTAPAEPTWASYSSLSTYDACPRRYAFRYVERVPVEEAPCLPFEFGSAAHAAFEAFTRERRERLARGEAPPTRQDLGAMFEVAWGASASPGRPLDEAFHRRVADLLDHFWAGELATTGDTIGEELEFDLALDPGDGAAPVRIVGFIDRVDRLPSGGIEVIDYKTGRASSQEAADASLQLSIYALACRDALGLGMPERVTLYFPESSTRLSTTRTDDQLDVARAAIIGRVARIRMGDFAPTPSPRTCDRCDYRAICPERA